MYRTCGRDGRRATANGGSTAQATPSSPSTQTRATKPRWHCARSVGWLVERCVAVGTSAIVSCRVLHEVAYRSVVVLTAKFKIARPVFVNVIVSTRDFNEPTATESRCRQESQIPPVPNPAACLLLAQFSGVPISVRRCEPRAWPSVVRRAADRARTD